MNAIVQVTNSKENKSKNIKRASANKNNILYDGYTW